MLRGSPVQNQISKVSEVYCKWDFFCQSVLDSAQHIYYNHFLAGLVDFHSGSIHLKQDLFVRINSLPHNYFQRILNLKNTYPECFKRFPLDSSEREIKEILLKLKHAYEYPNSTDFPTLLSIYPKEDDYTKNQKKFSILTTLLELRHSHGFKKIELFQLKERVGYEGYSHPKSFERLIRKIEKHDGDIYCLVPKNKGTKKILAASDQWYISKAFYYKARGYRLISEIHARVTRACEVMGVQARSKSFLKKYLNDPAYEELFAIALYGEKYFREKYTNYLEMNRPEKVFYMFNADGSRLQLMYYDEKSDSVKFLVLYIIIDCASSKVLGYSLDHTENKEMILEAWKMALENHPNLPQILITDRHSSHRSDEFSRIIEAISQDKQGMHIYAMEKSYNKIAENFFGIFPQFCASQKNYSMYSIVAVDKKYRTDKEIRYMALKQKKESLPVERELRISVDRIMGAFLNREMDTIGGSPNDIFEKLPKWDKRPLTTEQIAKCCWQRVVRTQPIHRMRVQLNKRKFNISPDDWDTKRQYLSNGYTILHHPLEKNIYLMDNTGRVRLKAALEEFETQANGLPSAEQKAQHKSNKLTIEKAKEEMGLHFERMNMFELKYGLPEDFDDRFNEEQYNSSEIQHQVDRTIALYHSRDLQESVKQNKNQSPRNLKDECYEEEARLANLQLNDEHN